MPTCHVPLVVCPPTTCRALLAACLIGHVWRARVPQVHEPEIEGIPIEDLVPQLTELLLERFDGSLKPAFETEQAEWRKAR